MDKKVIENRYDWFTKEKFCFTNLIASVRRWQATRIKGEQATVYTLNLARHLRWSPTFLLSDSWDLNWKVDKVAGKLAGLLGLKGDDGVESN